MILKLRAPMAAIILIGGLLILTCQKQDVQESSAQKLPVKTARVLIDSLAFPVHTSGILVSPTEMKLSFKIGGIIDRILAEEGTPVKKDQLLAVLDQSEIKASVQQARSGYEKALRDFQRVKSLYEDSVATLEQLQDSETGLTVARSALQIAEYNMQHSSIVAPTNGKILRRLAEQNELIDTGKPVFIFGSTEGSWLIRAGVPDRDIVKLQYGDTATLNFDAYPGDTFRATIAELAQSADPYTGTYEIELNLLPYKKRLVFGFIAEIEIYPTFREKYFLIPIESLIEADGKKGSIFYLEPSGPIARKRSITIDGIHQNGVMVRKGLEDIEQVITEGSPYLTDGRPVEVVN